MQRRSITSLLLFYSVISFCGIGYTADKPTHPGVGFAPRFQLDTAYQQDTPQAKLSHGDLVFTNGKTPASQLTPAEVYMVAGSVKSRLPDQRPLDAWVDDTMQMIIRYDRVHGAVPAVLDDAAIRSIPYYKDWPAAELDVYRNPITGNWPRLDAAAPSPGDMYVRKLTPAEVTDFAVSLGLQGEWLDASSGIEGAGTSKKHLCGPVFYQRVYGVNGPIFDGLPHMTCDR